MGKIYSYQVIISKQVDGGKELALFTAPVSDIIEWCGIPQKKVFDLTIESAGFQRVENPKRLDEIAEFLRNPENTLQNPLLCAERSSDLCKIQFTETATRECNSGARLGKLTIEFPDFDNMSYLDILQNVIQYLECRLPYLKTLELPRELISDLYIRVKNTPLPLSWNDESYFQTDFISDEEDNPDTSDNTALEELGSTGADEEKEEESSVALFGESHIEKFWAELVARRELLSKLAEYNEDSFLGFTREALLSYLMPVVLVDGQHRIKGALKVIEQHLSTPASRETADSLAREGKTAKEINHELAKSVERVFPISLLLKAGPEEHVFQFVVVNQKATAIPPALLGTIVSTSLSSEEIEGVASRLTSSGVPLELSRSASYLATNPESPFAGLVDRGLEKDSSKLLQWAVFTSLVNMFRLLKGGALYHEKNDYAASWRTNFLNESAIISGWEEKGFSSQGDYWSDFTGPWRQVFIVFWTEIRNRLANDTNPEADNFWGNPR